MMYMGDTGQQLQGVYNNAMVYIFVVVSFFEPSRGVQLVTAERHSQITYMPFIPQDKYR